MSRNVLIGIAIATVVLLAGVFAWRFYDARSGGGLARDRAGIVIVTNAMLDEMASAEERSAARELQIITLQSNSGAPAQSAASAQAPNQAANAAPQGQSGEQTNVEQDAMLIRNLMSDQMEAQLNRILTASDRFAVADPSTLRPVLQQMSQQRQPAQPAEQKDGRSQTVVDRAGAALEQGLTQLSAGGENGRVEAISATDPERNQDLASAARDLGVRYLLAVVLEQPHITYTSNAERVRMEADPVFVYRLYDVQQGRTLVSDVARMAAPVVVEIPWSLMAQENYGRAAHLARAGQEAALELQRAIAQQVGDHVLDIVHPATLARYNPMTITRGSNDGVQVGDTYEIIALDRANAIRDGGVVIDVPETPVGSARVVSVQRNSAVIEPAAGVTVNADNLRDYIVRRSAASEGGASGGGYAPSGGAGLGVADIAARQRGADASTISASVAVGDLRVFTNEEGLSVSYSMLQSAIAAGLSQDQRINVLSRESLEQLRSEQSLGAGGGRRSYLTSGGAIARAGFLVLGDVTLSTDRRAQTINVAGAAPRETSVSYYYVARGRLRIEALDSRLIGTFDVEARTPIASRQAARGVEAGRALSEAFATAAAQQILPHLFPMEIASITGSTVVLTRGADIGARVGDRVTMYRLSAPVIDRTTNRQISPGARTRVGEVTITDVQPTISTATIVGAYAPQEADIGEVSGPAPTARAASGSRQQDKQAEEPDVPW